MNIFVFGLVYATVGLMVNVVYNIIFGANVDCISPAISIVTFAVTVGYLQSKGIL